MDEPGQELTGRDLMIAVRRILVENPERHEQDVWLGNYYLTPDELRDGYTLDLSLDEMRPYALQPIRTQPEEPNSPPLSDEPKSPPRSPARSSIVSCALKPCSTTSVVYLSWPD